VEGTLEVGHALELTAPTHAVADGPSTALLGELFGEGGVTDLDRREAFDAAPAGRIGNQSTGAVSDTDEAVLVFSSGTTGLPKAVRHTHRSMGCATAHWCQALGLGPTDRFQVTTPPSHILGLLNLLAATWAGSTVRLHRRFDLDEVLHFIEAEHMTLEMAVAPIALAMANHPRLEEFDLSSLRYIMWGATPVSEAVATVVSARTGVRWLPAYGASEVPVIAANPVDRPGEWRLDSAGLPPAGVTLRVADLDTGAILGPGEIGEIQVLSPSVMVGYLPEEETPAAFSDGWYRTGDVGWLESRGWVHLTDRSKEMIKVNGFQVAPAEIEGVLHGHPAVWTAPCSAWSTSVQANGPWRSCSLIPISRSPKTSSKSSWPVPWLRTSTCDGLCSPTRSRACLLARCCAARFETSGLRCWPTVGKTPDGRPAFPGARGTA
jgi:long-chain acyl-CoA synthetase